MLDGSTLFFTDTARQHRQEQFCCLLTVTGDMPEPIRLVSDVVALVSRGNTYVALPFGWQPPSEGETQTAGRIVIQNVDKRIGEAVRAARGPLSCALEVVIRAEPDTVLRAFSRLLMVNGEVNGAQASFTIIGQRHANSAWPGIRATPAVTPGLWA